MLNIMYANSGHECEQQFKAIGRNNKKADFFKYKSQPAYVISV